MHPSRNRMIRLAACGLALGTAVALTSCSTQDGDASDELKVVATTTQLTDFAGQVGGDDIELTGLLTPGGSAHHFDPTPADLLALGEADVLIVNGAGLETFLDSAIEASGFDGEIIDASEGVDLDEAKAITAEAEAESGAEVAGDHAGHDHADHEHADDGHADAAPADTGHAEEAHDHAEEEAHDHGEEAHDHADEGHDHGDVNPHLWTSPHQASGMVSKIAGELARIDPDHADEYAERADAYVARLEALDAWAAAQFERVPAEERVLVSGHDSLRYFLHDYGIAFAGSILPSFEDNAEPSAADIDALVQAIHDRGVKAVFVESSMNPRLAETISKEAGVQVVTEDALYADSLGGDGSGAENYIDATAHNTRTILEAWGYTPDDLPAEIGAEIDAAQ